MGYGWAEEGRVMDENERRARWAATLPRRSWSEWNTVGAASVEPVAESKPNPTQREERDQIITGKPGPMIPQPEDFSSWETGALVREIWKEIESAFLGCVIGAPFIALGFFVSLLSSVPWLGDSVAGLVGGVFIMAIGVTIMWLGQRRWSAIRAELARRNANARRARLAGQRRAG